MLAAVLLAGCGSGPGDEDTRVRGDTLTIYMSAPAHGLSAEGGEAAQAGARRALSDAGGRVGRRRVRLVSLPSTRPGDDYWDPGTVEANAERATDDPTAIAYLGELDLGGSAVSLPVTNRAGLVQVSPADGLRSLTGVPPGRPGGGPERYYPEDRRTFVRLVPNDLEVAGAMLAGAERLGARRPAILHTEGVAERELAGMLAQRGRADGLEPAATEPLRDDADAAAQVAEDLVADRPDAVLLAGVPGPATTALLGVLAERLPGTPVICSAPMARAGPRAAPDGTAVVTPVSPPAERSLRARGLIASLGRGGAAAGPESLQGYEAMRLVLDAIEGAGPDRLAVARAALEPRTRESVLGPYSVRPSGDVEGLRLHVTGLGGGRPATALESP